MTEAWYKNYPSSVKHEIDLSKYTCIADAIEQTCREHSHRPALFCMGAQLDFQQFDAKAEAFAYYLQNTLGLKKGDRLAIMIPNVMQFPIVFFAAQKIGVICVNTNPLYTPREMKHQFSDSGAKAIVIIDLFVDKLEKIIKDTAIEHVVVTSIGDQFIAPVGAFFGLLLRLKGTVPKHNLQVTRFKDAIAAGTGKKPTRPALSHDDTAILQYTGGTTGVAKGAVLTQRNILANMTQVQSWARAIDIGAGEQVLTALPLYHIFALSVNFLAFLTMGSKMILVPKPVPIENTVKMFKKHNITILTGVNTLYNALNNNKAFQELAPKGIKIALAGGMALQDSVNRKWQQITGNRIIEGFGLTESSPVTHCNPVHMKPPVGSVGLPLPSTIAKVVNEKGEEVPYGDEGELIIKGPQVMKGYWQRDDETAKTIKDGWLYTGDMARQDEEGFFFIIDRKKDMILVSGFNVYPNEVEEVIAEHPKVLEVAVVGVPDKNCGEAVKAFVVKKDESLTEQELKSHCQESLTGYKRPRQYEFRKELPKSNIGKILRKELR